jgi:hypothetical protein
MTKDKLDTDSKKRLKETVPINLHKSIGLHGLP